MLNETGLGILIMIATLIMSISWHEFCHGYVANMLGDPTARQAGRMTLNPIAHIDPFLTILLPALLILSGSSIVFGAAKPIPINPYAFKNRKIGTILTSFAGPLSNFILVLIFSLVLNLIANIHLETLGFMIFRYFAIEMVIINVVLGLFNLIPIPPLDGSAIFELFLSERAILLMRQFSYFSIGLVFLFLIIFGNQFWSLVVFVIKIFIPASILLF